MIGRARHIVEDGERRIAAQEELIERLRAAGHSTDKAEDFLRNMRELLELQIRLREELERLVKDRNSST